MIPAALHQSLLLSLRRAAASRWAATPSSGSSRAARTSGARAGPAARTGATARSPSRPAAARGRRGRAPAAGRSARLGRPGAGLLGLGKADGIGSERHVQIPQECTGSLGHRMIFAAAPSAGTVAAEQGCRGRMVELPCHSKPQCLLLLPVHQFSSIKRLANLCHPSPWLWQAQERPPGLCGAAGGGGAAGV